MRTAPPPSPVETVDVLVVGAGPAGLAAAAELRRLGVGRIVVVDREHAAGGIPRHCGHSPFGMREFRRILSGPRYAARLADAAARAGADIRTGHSVTGLEAGGRVHIATSAGTATIVARRIVLATGAREMPRSARLVSGDRPIGILNTGALQAFAGLEHLVPFRRPVIVGTELVSLSAILTCRGIGARPAAIVEGGDRPVVRRPFMLLARLLGIPVHYGAAIADIRGNPRVEAVTIREADGRLTEIACDGVLFTGRFVPEASLARAAGIAVDRGSGGPAIDQFGRTSDPLVFAAGNLLRPIETAGWSWAEGRRVARFVADDLAGRLPAPATAVPISPGGGVRYVVPQRLSVGAAGGLDHLQLRLDRDVDGRLVVADGARTLWSSRIRSRPERRILVPIGALAAVTPASAIVVRTEFAGASDAAPLARETPGGAR